MKKLLFILSLSFSSVLFAQERNGITYQALIVDPSGEFLPGADNNYSPLKNTSVCLQFHIIDSTNSYEYSEQHTVTTDNFGMVNLVIGTGSAIGGVGWENVSWSASAKSLKVDVDKTGSCSSFEELSNQPLTSVPFALYSPGSDTPGPQGDPGEEGMSAYEVWLDLGNTGTEQDFIDSLKGPEGDPGDPGADGDSAYDVWIEAGNTGTEQEFLDSLKATDGNDGDSAYDIWIAAGNTGTEQEFLDSLKGAVGDPGDPGDPGADGDSAYDLWIAEGNTGTLQQFLDSLEAIDGNDGDSAYDIWIAAGNTGTEQEFLDSLKGEKGDPGVDGFTNTGSSMYFTEIEETQILLSKTSCETLDNDVDGMISPPGSGWTTNAALNFSSCWRTPNGSYKGGCESNQQWTAPLNCRIEPKTPLTSSVEHFYENINSSKIVITPPAGNQSFEISMKIEFMNANGDLISSFVEHSYVESYSVTKYFSSQASHEFLLNTINPRYSTSYPYYRPINELIFQLSENAVNLKITYEAIAPENPPSDFYVLVAPTYNSSGGSISYNWLQQEFDYKIFVWR
jgi:hypothetical protein